MKNGTELINSIKKRGYIFDEANNAWEPPNSARALELISSGCHNMGKNKSRSNRLKTGWIDDSLNLKNKHNRFDTFITLVRLDLGLEVWPEFYFTTERQYRFDYAIPVNINNRHIKIAVECDGGIQMHGNSGHSSPAGIARDMAKGTLAAVNGWILIRRTPIQLCTSETIALIRRAIENLP